MKKISLFAVVFALLFGFSQCTKKPLLPYPYYATNSETVTQEITVTASFPNNDSKVNVYDSLGLPNLDFRWEVGDSITLGGGASGTIRLYSFSEDSLTGYFKGKIEANFDPVTFIYGNHAYTGYYFNQTGTLSNFKSNICLRGSSSYSPSGYYRVYMKLPYAVLKLDLSAFEGLVTISEGDEAVASVKDVTKLSKELYVVVPETSGSDVKEYTFSDNNHNFARKIWKLAANTYYTAKNDTTGEGTGKAIVITPSTLGYVDLGLTSGTLWATRNVGAENPEDYGYYYAWGETMIKNTYNWSTYKWCNNDSYTTLTKYCTDPYWGYNDFVDNKTVLDMSDDAAWHNWDNIWRMPTKTEMEELINECTWTRATQNGKNGYTVTGSNGNSIFLPAAGYYDESILYTAGSCGRYWSSSLETNIPYLAFYLFFSNNVSVNYEVRCYGFPVRPVQSTADSGIIGHSL